MAQTGFTPIQLYSTSTAAAVPVAGNLTNSTLGSELAINITDGKLFYKDNANAVQVIGWKTVPTTAGGTGLTTYTAGDLSYYASGTTFTKLAIGTAGQILTSTGTAPQWTTLSGVAVTTFSAGTTGFTPNSATSGAVTLAGTLATTNGGTGLTAFTANRVFYASSTSAIGSSANLTFNGTTLVANDITDSSLTATRVTYAGTSGNLVDSANLTFNGTTLTSGGYSTSGNLTFTSTSNRILGDFSNATPSNRVIFQTSTTNASTNIEAIPNGTSVTSGWLVSNNSADVSNSSVGQFRINSGAVTLNSNIRGTGTYLPFTIETGNAERLRILGGSGTDVGYTGIGTATPASILTIYRLTAAANPIGSVLNSAIRLQADGSELNEKAEVQFQMGATAANTGEVVAAISGLYAGFNGANDSAGDLLLSTRQSTAAGGLLERVRVTAAGNVNVVTGNVVISTSGKGIDFSATPGTGTSELFDDYEEGTFTPTVSPGSGAITTYTSSGYYTKVGNVVTVQLTAFITTAGTAGGNLIFSLPFTSLTTTSGQQQYVGTVRESAATGVIYFMTIGSNTASAFVQTSANGAVLWVNGYTYTGSITYFSA